ncbi:hypothetical protein niasHT_024638 [Heterodera trifolii]|uniref:G-protein coupled receptors family 1 profile domain-containing protein n=1 Tax=Heterodera trifolii TaxID=157864 RepID=A0ABD2K7L0_9BILA
MASINTSSNDQLYLAYRSVGPSADLIVPAVALYLVALVGIMMNGTVLVVTVKSNSLRGSANFLMALICFCELIHQTGHTFFLVVVISGTNFVSLLTADLILTPMIFALNCGLMAMFCAAFDRLFAVALPFNTEYRCMFKKEFQALKGYFGNKNAVQTIGTIQVRISNPNNNMNNLYLAYRFAGPSADLIVPAVALNLVALVGIVLNGTVLVFPPRLRQFSDGADLSL